MSTPLRAALSHLVGWAADRRLPTALRPFAHRTFARLTGADLEEVRPPLTAYPSVGAFFVRRLVDGAREFPDDAGLLPSPCDGRLQAYQQMESGSDQALQAKGQSYSLRELLAGLESAEGGRPAVDLERARVWTIYLSPRDYHRIHCPVDSDLSAIRWVDGARFSVAPKVLAARPRVFVRNERAVLRLESEHGPWFLVLVGALNVGRIRVVGVTTGEDLPARPVRRFARGEELGRFELGSTAILVWPSDGPAPVETLHPHDPIRMGDVIGRFDAP